MGKGEWYLAIYDVDGEESEELIKIPDEMIKGDLTRRNWNRRAYVRDNLLDPDNLVALYRLEELITPEGRELVVTNIQLEKLV